MKIHTHTMPFLARACGIATVQHFGNCLHTTAIFQRASDIEGGYLQRLAINADLFNLREIDW